MESYITRQQVREVNRKLFANSIIYSNSDEETIDNVISTIIRNYNPEDEMASIPSIIEFKTDDINDTTLEKILLLEKNSVIIGINNGMLADKEKVQIIKRLKELGYKICVELNKDDEVFTLAAIFADIVKFNINEIPEKAFTSSNFNCKKFAYNVNSPEEYVIAESSNIDYYAGTYISTSDKIQIESNNHSKLNFIEIIAYINKNTTIEEISKIIARDSLMSAQLVRLSNTTQFGARYRIESIKDAITRIGLNYLKRWVYLLQFSGNLEAQEELLQLSYHRAIVCEAIIKGYKGKDITKDEAYMIGLFSTLDMMTKKSFDLILSNMNLGETIEDALIYRDGIGGTLLNFVKAYEEANWKRVDKYIKQFNLSKDKMFRIYFDSLTEVQNIWKKLAEINNN